MTLVSNDKLEALSGFIKTKMGLYFPQKKFSELSYKLIDIYKEFGFKNINDFIDNILEDKNTKKSIDALASKLTIGETYFWRDRELFRILEYSLLPEMIEKKSAGNKSIRIWSAGCSTGEEPYSIAILFNRLIPDLSDWRITITATDINHEFLNKASRGRYSEWSFHSAPNWLKGDYFTKNGGREYLLADSIRRMVKFSYLNLFDDAYPSLSNNTNANDIIFCRNVLMYFDTNDIREISDRLYNCLVDGGLLITSDSETFHYLSPRFKHIHHKGVSIYQKIQKEIKQNEDKKNQDRLKHKNTEDQNKRAASILLLLAFSLF
jgi:chemotaxis protein methyltransferase CheR